MNWQLVEQTLKDTVLHRPRPLPCTPQQQAMLKQAMKEDRERYQELYRTVGLNAFSLEWERQEEEREEKHLGMLMLPYVQCLPCGAVYHQDKEHHCPVKGT